MAYNITGKSHFSGVKNEKDVVDKLNKIKDQLFINFIKKISETYPSEYIHVGGTKYKKDASALSKDKKELFDITIKKHKSGTFDYINTSKISEYMGAKTSQIINLKLNRLKDNHKNNYQNKMKNNFFIEADLIKSKVRSEIKKISQECIRSINDDIIKKIFEKIKNEEPKLLIINNEKNGELVFLRKKDRFDINNIMSFSKKDTFELKVKKNAVESASIYKNKNDTGIRLRIVLNNGVAAFLGGNPNSKKSNKDSKMTIKLQNDIVSRFFQNEKSLKI